MMKKMSSKILSVVLGLMMILGSFSLSFADGGANLNVVAHPDYNSVTVTWNAIPGAASYKINGKSIGNVTSYNQSAAKNKTYSFNVVACDANGKTLASGSDSSKSVRNMYQYITFKKGKTLKSHGGANVRVKFKKGQTVVADGFGGGKYKFWYNGSYFYVSYSRVKNCTADYERDFNYDAFTAENFVNRSGQGSKTGYLIWVSTYTQHLYIFTGHRGHWKLYKDWECSTGKAASPTPTGFGKSLKSRMKKHSGIKWWWKFQSMNSIHGKRKSYKIGKPASHGCVRNYDDNAKWMYDTFGKGTGLIVF